MTKIIKTFKPKIIYLPLVKIETQE